MKKLQMEWPFITVVMPVRNEERFIKDTLMQILSQNYPPDRYEIIVADGESTDSTCQIVEEIAQNHSQVKLFNNPGRLPSSGRNIGFKNGKGDYFIVIDGHCRLPDKNVLKSVADAFLKSGAECLGRPQPFVIPEEPTWQRAIGIARTSWLGHSSSSYIHANEEGFVSPVSMGCAYKKEVFEKIGYVDEHFDACEDVEFNYRVEKAGFKTYFTPKIAVWYFPRENLKGLWRQLIRYGEGRAKFLFKHPETFNIEILLSVLFTLGVSLGWLSYFISIYLFKLYLVMLLIYFSLVSLESWRLRKKEPLEFVFELIIVFFMIHYSLGLGILLGMIKKVLKIS